RAPPENEDDVRGKGRCQEEEATGHDGQEQAPVRRTRSRRVCNSDEQGDERCHRDRVPRIRPAYAGHQHDSTEVERKDDESHEVSESAPLNDLHVCKPIIPTRQSHCGGAHPVAVPPHWDLGHQAKPRKRPQTVEPSSTHQTWIALYIVNTAANHAHLP